MEVILLERIEKLGHMGDAVSVKRGYARNYLLPKRKALRATADNKRYFEQIRAELEEKNRQQRQSAEELAEQIRGLSLVMIRQAGRSGQLYGSVSGKDVAAALNERGVGVDKRQIELERPIKSLGLYRVRILLHPEVSETITVNVAQSEDEAELQAQRGGMVTSRMLAEEEEAAERAAQEAAEAEAAETQAG